ncbi:MAG TPA: molybdopterin cofactor-binding domain-containing protein [Steroidobacteraceae bacterium]|nr:molybdopterin cofactor-binding domain-containing protein [Steroidobacteraceae bacterium]
MNRLALSIPGLRRREFLKAGGALIVSLQLGQPLQAQGNLPRAARGSVAGPPDAKQVDSWLAIHADNTATLYIGFAELGQGATTALLQVAAEELDLDLDQISAAQLDTHVTPNQGGTYSSAAVQRGRPQVAAAAAEARAALLGLAAVRLEAPVGELVVTRGTISVGGAAQRRVTYGQLVGGKSFDLAVSGNAPLKSADSYRLVGKALPRGDLAAKLTGRHRYIQQMKLPGMLHARVVRPRGQSAYGAGARLISVDESSIAAIPGARLLRRGDFLGVVAPREWDAIRAARDLNVTWDNAAALPRDSGLHAQMRSDTADVRVALERGDCAAAFVGAAQVATQRCLGPYQAHAPFAPNCALADVRADTALVICASQDIYNARRGIAPLLGMKPEQLRVQYAAGAGTYGHSGYDDAAQAAALLSQLAGAPVRLQFMRWDEHGWDTYGPAHVGEVRAAATAAGKLLAYEYHGWQHNWSLTETTAQLAGGQAAEWPVSPVQGVSPLNCGGMYEIPNLQLVNHRLQGLRYLKGAWLRSPLDLSLSFASEQAIDQLAFQLALDPCDFRRQNIKDDRWRGVLDAVAQAANWTPRRATTGAQGDGGVRRGRGIGLGTHLVSHGAAVAEIEVDTASGAVRILHLYGALDAGLVVNPGIVSSQITGQLVQTASRMLKEEVTFDDVRVTSLDWSSYPILRFAECPQITPIVVQQLDQRSTGAGEETMAAAAAAIANAFFDATGRRLEQYPLTPQRVLAALAAPPTGA